MPKLEQIYGLHSVLAGLRRSPERLVELWIDRGRQDGRIREIEKLAGELGIAIRKADARDLDRRCPDAAHQGVVAAVAAAEAVNENTLLDLLDAVDRPPFLLVLDGVTDPHNLGACLRSADGAGVTAVIVPRDRAAGLTPVARKVASGAAETVPFVQVTNLARTLDTLRERGIWVIGLAGEATQDVYDADLTGPLALVLGAEGEGMRRLTRERCDVLVRIPMRGAVESLNVSVATGVCLYEAVRQRRGKGGSLLP